MKELWVEKYRPRSLEDYVWVDPAMREVVEHWLKDGALPHCLFSGVQGTGKTSLAMLLLKALKIPDVDVLYVNASRERVIDAFQDKVVTFVQAWPMGDSGIKYVLLDESDRLSPLAQGLLRAELEAHSDVARFILTANYPKRIIPAIHSRLQELRFPSLNREDFVLRLAQILESENIDYEPETLLAYSDATYPDLRKCINMAQQNSLGGKLAPLSNEPSFTQDWMLTLLDLFRAGKYIEARSTVLNQIQSEQYDDFFRLLYNNLDALGATQDQQDEALLIISRAMKAHAVASVPEINAAAMMIELAKNAR